MLIPRSTAHNYIATMSLTTSPDCRPYVMIEPRLSNFQLVARRYAVPSTASFWAPPVIRSLGYSFEANTSAAVLSSCPSRHLVAVPAVTGRASPFDHHCFLLSCILFLSNPVAR